MLIKYIDSSNTGIPTKFAIIFGLDEIQIKSAASGVGVFALFIVALSSLYIPEAVIAQEIEEVEIIAEQLEEESLDDLVSVSALDAEKLADAGIENVEVQFLGISLFGFFSSDQRCVFQWAKFSQRH